MARRGRCRCGKVLKFRQSADGYKRRCSRCGAVVRLVVDPSAVLKAPADPVPSWTFTQTEALGREELEERIGSADLGEPELVSPLSGPLGIGPGKQAPGPPAMEIELVPLEPPPGLPWGRLAVTALVTLLGLSAAVGVVLSLMHANGG